MKDFKFFSKYKVAITNLFYLLVYPGSVDEKELRYGHGIMENEFKSQMDMRTLINSLKGRGMLFSVILFVASITCAYSGAPSVTGVNMTGAMKEGFSVTINYTYNANPNPEAGTTFQWFTYDNSCGLNKQPIVGATSKTFLLTAAQIGKNISCEITPKDNAGVTGAIVEFKPWDCSTTPNDPLKGPNKVLPQSMSCSRAGGAGTPNPFNDLVAPTELCSPRTVVWNVKYTGIDYSNTPQAVPVIIVDWDDGNVEYLAATLENPTETNMSDQRWSITKSHTYDYKAGITNPSDGSCSFIIKADFALDEPPVALPALTSCTNIQRQIQTVTVWDTEDNAMLARFDINHDPNSAGIEPGTPPETTWICRGDVQPIRLLDASKQNCTPGNPGNETNASRQNSGGRWVQWVYGTSTTLTGPVTINGVTYLPSQFPVYGPIEYYSDPNLVPNSVTKNITMPATGLTGQYINVTLRKWNACNQYDDNQTPNPLDPIAGTFTVGPNGSGTWLGATFPNAVKNFVKRDYQILIIDAPDAPIIPARDICANDDQTLTVSPVIAGLTYKWYNTTANASSDVGSFATGPSYTKVARVTGVFNYYVTATAANGCVSPPGTATLSRRTQPPPPLTLYNSPNSVCANGTYVYKESLNFGTYVPGGPMEFVYSIIPGPTGSSATIISGQGTKVITLKMNGIPGTFDIKMISRFIAPSTDGVQCESNPKYQTITIYPNPIASPLSSVNICQGTPTVLDGNPSSYTGKTPVHLWTGSTGILNSTSIQAPSVLAGTAPGSYTLNYKITDSIGCSSPVMPVTVTISTKPPIANAGPDQNLCQVSLVSNALSANAASPGVGTWSIVSMPPTSTVTTSAFSNVNSRTSTFTADKYGKYVLRWSIANGACSSFDDVTVDFGQDPGVVNAGADQTLCGLNAQLLGVAPSIGSITWTQISGPGVASYNDVTIPKPNVTVTGFGTYRFQYAVKSGNCPIRTDMADVTFSNSPLAQAPSDFNACVDNPVTVSIPVSGTVAGTATKGGFEIVSGSGKFLSSGTAIGSIVVSSSIADSYIPSVTDFTNGSVVLKLVAYDPTAMSPCPFNEQQFTITFDRMPSSTSAGTDQNICGNSTVLNASGLLNGGKGQWSTATPGVVFADKTNPLTTVSNIPVGPITFTWTVSSTLGVCGDQNDDVIVTRNTPPDNIDPTPSICEDSYQSGSATVTLAYLNSPVIKDSITGLVGSPSRIVEYFSDPMRLTPITGSKLVSNGDIIYTRVTSTDFIPNCTKDGVITWTVNGQPVSKNIAPEYCADVIGGTSASGINLLNLVDSVTANVTNNQVTWYQNASRTTLVPDPSNVSGVNGDKFYPVVTENLSGCTSNADVTLVVNQRPGPNPIIGSTLVCQSSSDIYLYQASVIHPGSTYQWNIPTEFTKFVGAGPNDFFVLLNFPMAVPLGKDLSFIETSSKGCVGVLQKTSIIVQSAPPALTISGAPKVCEYQSGVNYSVPNLSNTTYNWTVPAGASIVSGQGTSMITVTFGTIAGDVTVKPSTLAGCQGVLSTFPVTLNKNPVLLAGLDKSVCSREVSGITFGTDPFNISAVAYNVTSVVLDPGIVPVTAPVQGYGLMDNAIFNDSYINKTGGPLKVTYTVEAVSTDNCAFSPGNKIYLTIMPEPVIDSTLDKAICSTVASGVLLQVKTGSSAAASYTITDIRVDASLVANAGNQTIGSGKNAAAISGDKFTNNGTFPKKVEYDVVPVSSSGCAGEVKTITITVSPIPIASGITMSAVCSNTTFLIDPQNQITNGITSTFTWSAVYDAGLSGGLGSGSSTISETLKNRDVVDRNVTYTIVPTSSDGCSGIPFQIVVPIKPEVVYTDITSPDICSVFTYNPGITFTWTASYGAGVSGGSGSGTNAINEVLINNGLSKSNVLYTITPTGGLCSSPNYLITVPVNQTPTSASTIKSPVCSNATFSFDPQANINNGVPSTYTWTAVYDAGLTGGAGSGSGLVGETLINTGSSTLNAVYTVTPTSSVGCSGNTFTITEPVKTDGATPDKLLSPICSGDVIIYSDGTAFSWSAVYDAGLSGGIGSGTNVITDLPLNTSSSILKAVYTITPTVVTGCSSAPYKVTVPVDPIPDVIGLPGTVTICSNGSVNIPLASSLSATNFTWDAKSSSTDITGATAGNGTAINQTIANNGALPGVIDYTITPVGIAPKSCVGKPVDVVVNVNQPVDASFLGPDFTACENSNTALNISLTGKAPYTFGFTDGVTSTLETSPTKVFIKQIKPTTTTTYTITSITDANSCALPLNEKIKVTAIKTDAIFTINQAASLCDQFNVQIQYNEQVGATYTWMFLDGSSDSTYTSAATAMSKLFTHRFKNTAINNPTKFPINLQVSIPSDNGNCGSFSQQSIQIAPAPTIYTFSADTVICSGETVSFTNLSKGGIGHRWFYRDKGNVGQELNIINQTNVSDPVVFTFVNATGQNPKYYDVVYQLQNGSCSKEKITTVVVYAVPQSNFSASPNPAQFLNGSTPETSLTSTTAGIVNPADYQFVWDFGIGSSPSSNTGTGTVGQGPIPVNYYSAGSRDVTLKVINIIAQANGENCFSTVTKPVVVISPSLSGSFDANPKQKCAPAKITVTNNTWPHEELNWKLIDSSGKVVAQSSEYEPVFDVVAGGAYHIKLAITQQVSGVTVYDSLYGIEMYAAPRTMFDTRPNISMYTNTKMSTFNMTDQSQGGQYSWLWNFGDSPETTTEEEPKHTYVKEGTYVVTLITGIENQTLQCYDTLKKQVQVLPGGGLKIPNAFTPNPSGPNDGRVDPDTFNDVFLPITDEVNEFHMQIFDRWGNLIFESNDRNIGWNGYNQNGILYPAGVYVYKLTYRIADQQRTTKLGDISLIR